MDAADNGYYVVEASAALTDHHCADVKQICSSHDAPISPSLPAPAGSKRITCKDCGYASHMPPSYSHASSARVAQLKQPCPLQTHFRARSCRPNLVQAAGLDRPREVASAHPSLCFHSLSCVALTRCHAGVRVAGMRARMRNMDHSMAVATGAAVLQGVATGSSPATNGVRTLKKNNIAASPFVLHAATPSRFSSSFAAAAAKRVESLDAPPSSLRAGVTLCSMHSRAVGASQSPLNPQQEQTSFDR